MRVNGLVINEDLSSGLLHSQFIKPLAKLKEEGHSVKVIYISKIGLTSEKEIEGIEVVRLPLAIPYRAFCYSPLAIVLIPLISVFYALLLAPIISSRAICISRGYFPSLILSLLSVFRSNLEFIFDPRSLFVDESLVNGNLQHNSVAYRLWRRIEKFILKKCDKAICVSHQQKKIYGEIYDTNMVVIPCYSEWMDKPFIVNKKMVTERHGIPNDKILIAYFGSIDTGWNNIEIYANFLKNNSHLDAHFVFISQNFKALRVHKAFQAKNVSIIGEVEFSEKIDLLSCADFGLFLMAKNPDWETRLGVKFADYTSLGLPVILSEFVGEAVYYLNKYGKNGSLIIKNSQRLAPLEKPSLTDRENLRVMAQKHFSYSNIIKILN